MPRTMPDDVAEAVSVVMRIMRTMIKAAQQQAKSAPAHDGLYPVMVIMDSSGAIVCDDNGGPLIVIPPLTVARTSETTVEFFRAEQRVSPKQAADIAGIHKATLQRAVNAGELPKPTQISSRRVVHKLSDIQAWFAKREANV